MTLKNVVGVRNATKVIKDMYLYHASCIRALKKWFWRFWNVGGGVDFILNDKIRVGWSSGIDNDLKLHGDLVNNNPGWKSMNLGDCKSSCFV